MNSRSPTRSALAGRGAPFPVAGVLFVICAALSAIAGGCIARERYRPVAELAHGAAAVVPWAAVELSACAGRRRSWRLPVRNPVGRAVRLRAPHIEGCGNCMRAYWASEGATADASRDRVSDVALAPGEVAVLQLDYTGAPVPAVGRYLLELRLASDHGPPLQVPVRVVYTPDDPLRLVQSVARVETGTSVPARFALRGAACLGLNRLRLSVAGEPVAGRLLPPGWAGGDGLLEVFPSAPWPGFASGVLEVGQVVGDAATFAWEAAGVDPVLVDVRRSAGGFGSLRLRSQSARALTVRVAAFPTGPAVSGGSGLPGGTSTTLRLAPHGRGVVPFGGGGGPASAASATASELVVDVDSGRFVKRLRWEPEE